MRKNLLLLVFTLYIFVQPNLAQGVPRSKFKVLYSNDTTHITTCTGPYHKAGEAFRPEMLVKSVRETAGTGVEVHLLQPGTIWTPWWQSDVYSMQDHYDWFLGHYGVKPDNNSFNEYVLRGGDLVKDFIGYCEKAGEAAFISVRMNDAHFLETWDDKAPNNAASAHCLSKFYVEHTPEYCVGYEKGKEVNFRDWDARNQNWAIKEVRDYKLSLIEELCRKYDFAGLELDFMRHSSYFNLKQTSVEQRIGIMTDVIRTVRGYLDANSRDGYRWLCVRIPAFIGDHERIGVDVAKWADAGVDMFNVSSHYFTCQQTDIGEMVKLAPDKTFYLEMTQATRSGKILRPGYDGFSFRRTTAEQYYTAAHLAYSRGASGVSTFNFQYYRSHGGEERGPFHEPPFEVFNHIADKEWVARQPQHYILASVWDAANRCCAQLPKMGAALSVGDVLELELDMAEPTGGWVSAGRFRVQTDEVMPGQNKFEVWINGQKLAASRDVSEPYPNPYTPLCGPDDTLRAWQVPAENVRDGINTVKIRMVKGEPVKVVFVDLAIK